MNSSIQTIGKKPDLFHRETVCFFSALPDTALLSIFEHLEGKKEALRFFLLSKKIFQMSESPLYWNHLVKKYFPFSYPSEFQLQGKGLFNHLSVIEYNLHWGRYITGCIMGVEVEHFQHSFPSLCIDRGILSHFALEEDGEMSLQRYQWENSFDFTNPVVSFKVPRKDITCLDVYENSFCLGTGDGNVVLWNPEESFLEVLEGQKNPSSAPITCIHKEGDTIVYSQEGTLHFYNRETKVNTSIVTKPIIHIANYLESFCCITNTGKVLLFDRKTYVLSQEQEIKGMKSSISKCVIRDGVLYALSPKKILLWSLERQELNCISLHFQSTALTIYGEYLFIGFENGAIHVYNRYNKEHVRYLFGHYSDSSVLNLCVFKDTLFTSKTTGEIFTFEFGKKALEKGFRMTTPLQKLPSWIRLV